MKPVVFSFLILVSILAVSCQSGEKDQNGGGTSDNLDKSDSLSQLEREHLLYMETYADSVNKGYLADTFKGSARREAIGTIGDVQITVNYGSPGVRGRVIWNGLVSYDQVWVTGSHWATAVHFSEEVRIQQQSIPPGWYGFFTIPGREKWTLILNKTYDQHLAEAYDPEEDLLRIETSPIVLADTVQRLTYAIEPTGDGAGILSMSWDKIRLELPIEDI
ncbi:Protein of unknown function [Cyclobacterium xiamenense]|uniref:DUF2911 domain-containing protein n=1 Tax=Cyclobacterium xiamenense TaxID=1297121 RepID=A0A1H7AHQ8_9BACT|nr:DUF2911 domain-containing protein [Cyclobacterium xiamenense]SEJ65129.1 Protein of unknown function [Cyclobacterium xiamenense]